MSEEERLKAAAKQLRRLVMNISEVAPGPFKVVNSFYISEDDSFQRMLKLSYPFMQVDNMNNSCPTSYIEAGYNSTVEGLAWIDSVDVVFNREGIVRKPLLKPAKSNYDFVATFHADLS